MSNMLRAKPKLQISKEIESNAMKHLKRYLLVRAYQQLFYSATLANYAFHSPIFRFIVTSSARLHQPKERD